jgi:hypothetical protein
MKKLCPCNPQGCGKTPKVSENAGLFGPMLLNKAKDSQQPAQYSVSL